MSDEEEVVGFRVGDRVVDAWGREVEAAADAVDYSSWSAKDLMAEIDKRNQDRDEADQIVLEGKKKADAAKALKADDEAYADEDEE